MRGHGRTARRQPLPRHRCDTGSTGRAKALTCHPLAIASTAADIDAELARLAATSPVYQPAGPQTDDPAEWAVRPLRFARFVCRCGARFHVRRHL